MNENSSRADTNNLVSVKEIDGHTVIGGYERLKVLVTIIQIVKIEYFGRVKLITKCFRRSGMKKRIIN